VEAISRDVDKYTTRFMVKAFGAQQSLMRELGFRLAGPPPPRSALTLGPVIADSAPTLTFSAKLQDLDRRTRQALERRAARSGRNAARARTASAWMFAAGSVLALVAKFADERTKAREAARKQPCAA
jgi:hypothetical protein